MQQLSLMPSRPARITLAVIFLAISLVACSPSETLEDKLSRATSLDELVEAIIHTAPVQAACTTNEACYLAAITEHTNIICGYPLLKAKELSRCF